MEAKYVYSEIKSSRPDLKVIIYSGYFLEEPAQKILDAGADGFIQKPFFLNELSRKINEVLKS